MLALTVRGLVAVIRAIIRGAQRLTHEAASVMHVCLCFSPQSAGKGSLA